MTEREKSAVEIEDVGALFRRYIVMVRGRALRILGNPALAEDVAQEVFVKYWRRRVAGGSEENTAAFLYRMSTNLALNHLRDSRRRRELNEGAQASPAEGQELCPEDLLAIRQILAKTPEDEARIASYYYLDGMDQDEIAALLSMQRRTVGRRLDRFHQRARRMLEKSRPAGGK